MSHLGEIEPKLLNVGVKFNKFYDELIPEKIIAAFSFYEAYSIDQKRDVKEYAETITLVDEDSTTS